MPMWWTLICFYRLFIDTYFILLIYDSCFMQLFVLKKCVSVETIKFTNDFYCRKETDFFYIAVRQNFWNGDHLGF